MMRALEAYYDLVDEMASDDTVDNSSQVNTRLSSETTRQLEELAEVANVSKSRLAALLLRQTIQEIYSEVQPEFFNRETLAEIAGLTV